MSLAQQVQQWVDGFFAQLEREYSGRPLIRAVLAKIQRAVDAQLPQLVAQDVAAVVRGLTAAVDQEFAALAAEVQALPLLAGSLTVLNRWIDAEIARLGQQLLHADARRADAAGQTLSQTDALLAAQYGILLARYGEDSPQAQDFAKTYADNAPLFACLLDVLLLYRGMPL